ncbi:hypothetical protein Vadar_010093 [Vaccinium darrowii]|uniref:Uncharacterized protein n=1 Tax=Vaccinium darrowii TaxID=229202 RepID=A0ACB7Z3A9_9ERIC|nr:hypothetical protein Vadar_010093 [Vaccinium darrowii]
MKHSISTLLDLNISHQTTPPKMANATSTLLLSPLFTTLLLLLIHPSSSTAVHRRSALSSQAFIAEILTSHNTLRARLYLPPLQWSQQLASYARWWANQRKGDCAMIHSTSNYGENIFWGQGGDWTATEAVEAWEAEDAYYNYGSNTCMPNRDCTHYTQMVWRGTTSVGCAKVKCYDGDTFIVCEYAPHGNIYGLRPY